MRSDSPADFARFSRVFKVLCAIVFAPVGLLFMLYGWVGIIDLHRRADAEALCASVRAGEPIAAVIARASSE
jgi:hypothetical protein